MKRLLSAILVLLMLALPCMAEADDHEHSTYAPSGSGISLTLNHWVEEVGASLLVSTERSSADPCEYSNLLFYCAAGDAEGAPLCAFALCNRLTGSDYAPEEAALTNQQVLATDGERELVLFYADVPEDADEATQNAMTLPVEWLLAHPEDVALSEPLPQAESVGFDALYGINAVDGSPVTADVLSGHKLTMINVWATYCNPCISEMPELGKLNAAYAEKGFQIIGVISDANASEAPDADSQAYAQVIIDQTGADYLHLIPGEGLLRGTLAEVTAVPTTYFVDENGLPVGDVLVGSRSYEDWAAIVDGLLASLE